MKHLPGCAHVQNMAKPRSMRLIGPKCECADFYRRQDEFNKWLDSDEGKEAIEQVRKELAQEDDEA